MKGFYRIGFKCPVLLGMHLEKKTWRGKRMRYAFEEEPEKPEETEKEEFEEEW